MFKTFISFMLYKTLSSAAATQF